MPILLPSDLFAEIAESINVLVAEMGTGKIVWMSRPLEGLFGCRYHGELIEHDVEDLIPEPMRERHRIYRRSWEEDPISRPMGKGRPLVGLRRDGTTFPVEVSLRAMYVGGKRLVVAEFMSMEGRHSSTDLLPVPSPTAST